MRTALLCAGDIGFQAAAAVLESHADSIVGLVTYRVEPPQDVYLARLEDLAARHGVPFFDLTGRERRGLAAVFDEIEPGLAVALKWRTLIDRAILSRTPRGVVVFHASLLPKYRGFAPIPWPLINGESETGLTMFYATDEVDAGDVIEQRRIPISPDDDAASLEQKVAKTAVAILSDLLPALLTGTAPRRPQDDAAATYCIWRRPRDGEIDWSRPAREIHNLVRGLTRPYPGAYTTLDGNKVAVWRTALTAPQRQYVGAIPGKVESINPGAAVTVLTGDGLIDLVEVEIEDSGPQPAGKLLTKLYTQLGS
jgi:methionyl-tRNA formyltransferase